MVGEDRAQLILVGAVAIAIIVVGLVLVVNTALFTEVVGSEGTVEVAKDSGAGVQSLEDAVSALAHNRTRAGAVTGSNDIDETTLDRRLRNVSLDSKGTFVSIEAADTNQRGTYVYRDSSADFGDVSGGSATFARGVDVGYFVLAVDVGASSGTMTINVTGSDGTSEELNVSKSASSEITLSGANADDCSGIQSTDGTVRIDLTGGAVYERPSCTFDLFSGPDPGYDVTSSGGEGFQGRFDLVTDYDGAGRTGLISSVQDEWAIWTYDLTYRYHTDEVTATGEREVRVYD